VDLKHNPVKNAGFTLIEIILSLATIGIIAGISIPVYQSFQVRNDLDIATVEIAQSARRAQILSQAVDGDTSWGVKIQSASTSISIFKGVSYSARDLTFDEIFYLPPSITVSGLSEIVFGKFTGLPVVTGTTTLTSNTNETRNITINAKGTINY
jgi:prepilin-type N-terminal cleavage/methylation domain-containing protein